MPRARTLNARMYCSAVPRLCSVGFVTVNVLKCTVAYALPVIPTQQLGPAGQARARFAARARTTP